MSSQRLLVNFTEKTRSILTVLYYLIQCKRYALYCIALEMEEINYLYLYLYPYDRMYGLEIPSFETDKCNVADPGSGAFLIPGSGRPGWVKN